MIWRRVESGNGLLKKVACRNVRDIYICVRWHRNNHAVLMINSGGVPEVIPTLASENVIIFNRNPDKVAI